MVMDGRHFGGNIMELIQNSLNSYLRGSSRIGTNQIIARYLLAYLDEIPNMRLAEVADACHVSSPSVIRFCREIGFEDFTDFKNRILDDKRSYQDNADGTVQLDIRGTESEYRRSVALWGRRIVEQTTSTFLALDKQKIERLAADILRYRYVYLFGMSLANVFTEYLRILLIFRDKTISALNVPNYQAVLSPDKSDTLGVIVSQHGRFLKSEPQLMDYMKKNCDRVWLITQETGDSTFIKDENHTLFVLGDKSPSIELRNILSAAELLSETVKLQQR